MANARPLGALDAVFLYLDTPRTPMHMGTVAVFEGRPLCDAHGRVRIEALRADVERRVDLVPKLRQRVRFPVAGETAPVWVDDPAFDLAAHMRVVALPAPGTMDQLAESAAEILAEPLATDFALWEMWFVEGLAGGRVGLIEKLHHSLADGLGGVELATLLLDTTRRHHPRPAARPWYPEPAPTTTSLVARDIAARGATALRGARRVVQGLARPLSSARALVRAADAMATLASPRLVAPRSSINGRIGRARRVAFVTVSLDHVIDVERAHEATVNDVLLAAVAGGLRRMLLARGDALDGCELQVLVPVGVPGGPGTEPGDYRLGDHVSAMLARLPVGVGDPVERLRAVRASTSHAKARRQAVAASAVLAACEPLPQPLLAVAARALQHQPVVNLVVTDVPGPSRPFYAHGARMLEAFPIVPLAGNLSISVAALRYDGRLHIGLYADRDRCPDLDVLADGIRRSFEELALAGPGRGGEIHDALSTGRARAGRGPGSEAGALGAMRGERP